MSPFPDVFEGGRLWWWLENVRVAGENVEGEPFNPLP